MLGILRKSRQVDRGQGMVEFALVLPLLLLVIFGVIETGRLLFVYSVVFTSTREAARYGSASGLLLSGNIYQYQDCGGIRAAAKRVGSLAGIQDSDITVTYDRVTGSDVSTLGSCPVGSTGPRLTLGNRVTVRVSVNYQPLVPFPNLPSFPIVSVSSRTILKDISIEGDQVGSSSSLPTVRFVEQAETDKREDIPASWNVVVRLSDPTDEPVTVNFSLGGSADPGGDYHIGETSPIIIPAGELEATIPITAVADDIYEDNETIVLTMVSTINATRGTPYILELAIIDDDGPPLVSFKTPTQEVGENYPEIRIPIQLNHRSETDVQVTFNLIGGSALEGIDYEQPDFTLTIPAGTTSADIFIRQKDDTMYDPNKTLVANLESASPGTLGSLTQHTVTIVDNDVEPAVSFIIASQTASEATGTVLSTVVLRRGLEEVVAGAPVSVNFSVGGTAESPADYDISPKSLTIPVGSSRANIVVNLVNDHVAEVDETVVVTLDSASNAALGSPSTHTLTITSTPTVYFTLPKQNVDEDRSEPLNIEVRLLPAQTVPVSVPFILSGTALQGQDYTMGTKSPLVIPAGSTSANLVVNLIADSLYELDEGVVLELGNPTNAVLGEPNVHLLTILKDNLLPQVTFTQPSQDVDESVGNASVQMQLDIASSLPITVPLTLSGSAFQGIDYNFNQTLVVIPPGSTGVPLSVEIINDVEGELDETILFSMGPPTNAIVGTYGTHTIRILANDQPVCPIDDTNPLVINTNNLSWTLRNTGTGSEQLALHQLTITWPEVPPNAPKFAQVYFGSNLVYDGNHPISPHTVTNWLGFESYRLLRTGGSTVNLGFTRSLGAGSYTLSLVFRNVSHTPNFDCRAVTRSIVYSPPYP